MATRTMAIHPANNGRKTTVRGLNQLPVPKTVTFRASLESIDRSSILDSISRSATIKTRLKFKGAFRLFSVHRLLAAHLRKQKIRRLAQRLFAWSVEHVLNVQLLARVLRKASGPNVDFASLLVDFAGDVRKVKTLLRRWFVIEPSDRKVFEGFSPESIMFGIAATIRA